MNHAALAAAMVALSAYAPAFAQQEIGAGEPFTPTPLADWNYGEVAGDGWSVIQLLESDVYGAEGEDLGDVEDVVFGPDGQVISLVAEVGGFLDIGDTHVSVPWDQVEMTDPTEGAMIPVTEDNVGQFDAVEYAGVPGTELEEEITPGLDDVGLAGRAWRANELIGDYARLTGEDPFQNYGFVSDIIVRNGQIVAAIVNASAEYGGGFYGYPAHADYARGWTPGGPYYDMPYTVQDIENIEPMDDTFWD